MYNFKIKKIITKYGEIEPKRINIIIGANNCGKSRFLKDIKDLFLSNSNKENTKIVNKIQFDMPKSIDEFINSYKINDRLVNINNMIYLKNYYGINNNEVNYNDNYLNSSNISISSDWKEQLKRYINGTKNIYELDDNLYDKAMYEENIRVYYDKDRNEVASFPVSGGDIDKNVDYSQDFLNTYGELFFLYIGTEEKLLLTKIQNSYGINDTNTNFLSELRLNGDLQRNLSDVVKTNFKKDIVLDTTTYGSKISLRVGKDFESYKKSSKNNIRINNDLSKNNNIDDEGDGLKCFVTTYMSLFIENKNVVLLDEPEAFLHPPLARKLGEIIGKAAGDNKQIFIATHSSEILKGILSTQKDINIIRIDREENTSKINSVSYEELNKDFELPSIIASNVVDGLFSKYTFICEAYTDQVFYSELIKKAKEITDFIVIPLNGNGRMPDVSKFYDKLGVPNISIYDFDTFRNIDEVFKKILKYKGFSYKEQQEIKKMIRELCKLIEEKAKKKKIDVDDAFHQKGIRILSKDEQRKFNELFEKLRSKNIIVKRNGELETSMEEFNINYIKGSENKWANLAINELSKSKKYTPDKIKKSNIYKEIKGDLITN